jgi:pyridoxine 4-dehydrogenase
MLINLHASASGQFTLADDISVNRLGFGAMRITGPGIWGEPDDRQEALRTLKRASALGINLIDTADSYGPEVSENLIREALYPYSGITIATKGGLTRQGPDSWTPVGRPEYLRQCVLMSLRRLGLGRIDLWQLHRIDPKVPRDEQFDVIRQMHQEGLFRHVGLSQVSVQEIDAARKYFPVATVQNQYNLVMRQSEAVLDYCTAASIGFIPWFPLASGRLEAPGSVLAEIAKQQQVSPGAIALAWLLKRSPVMLPIPGTSHAKHLEDNIAGANVTLSDEEFARLDAEGRRQQTEPV